MADLVLPFDVKAGSTDGVETPFESGLYRLLPDDMQAACQRNPQLIAYLRMLPIDETGVPEYYQEMSRALGRIKRPNLIYPVSDQIHIHVLSTGDERDHYIPIEPTVGVDVTAAAGLLEARMVELAYLFEGAETTEDRREVLHTILLKLCRIVERPSVMAAPKDAAEKPKRGLFGLFPAGNSSRATIEVTQREFDALEYMIARDKIGMGTLEPFVHDNWIEDISCSGLGPIFIEHKVFKSMRSALEFVSHETLDEFVLRLSEAIQRPVTLRNPIVDAVLADGSRINIVYGREVSQRGSNFTIRKFPGTPLSIMELIAFGSMSYEIAAYTSLVLEAGMNAFICGETASGKTTLINALTLFVSPDAKIVSIEDTPEVIVPHPNWIREVSRVAVKTSDGPGVSMFDLLKAALRQRPNLIIIGEIRGEEGAIAFQAMQTGHAVMATFHAASVEKLIQRLTGSPINVPKSYIENLNVAIMQSLVKLPDGSSGRRAISISEIVGYDPPSDSFTFVEVFRWNQVTDEFEFLGQNSYLLEERIAPMKGFSPSKRQGIYRILDSRAKLLRKLHERGVTGYYELLRVLSRAQKEGIF